MSPQILFFVMPGTMKWKNQFNYAIFVPQILFHSLAKAPRRKVVFLWDTELFISQRRKTFYGTQICTDLRFVYFREKTRN